MDLAVLFTALTEAIKNEIHDVQLINRIGIRFDQIIQHPDAIPLLGAGPPAPAAEESSLDNSPE